MNVKKRSTKEILNNNLSRSCPDLMQKTSLWLHNIRSQHNVGSAFRTSDGFGLTQIHLSGYTPQPPKPQLSKTALGADEYLNWHFHREATRALATYKQQGTHLVAIEQTHESKPLPEFTPKVATPVLLLFGNEVTGLDQSVLDICDEYIEIPQYGQKHSFNISVSIGIVLYHTYLKSLQTKS